MIRFPSARAFGCPSLLDILGLPTKSLTQTIQIMNRLQGSAG